MIRVPQDTQNKQIGVVRLLVIGNRFAAFAVLIVCSCAHVSINNRTRAAA